jgi:hypothetical protein
MARVIEDAQHEAAHVVVGVALGLKLVRATALSEGAWLGGSTFMIGAGDRYADLICTAAGVAWERRCGDLKHALSDVAYLRRVGVKGTRPLRTLERAAWALLETRASVHARVTRALLEEDLDDRSVRALVRHK